MYFCTVMLAYFHIIILSTRAIYVILYTQSSHCKHDNSPSIPKREYEKRCLVNLFFILGYTCINYMYSHGKCYLLKKYFKQHEL